MITGKWYVSTLCAVILSLGWVRAWADPPQFPHKATFTTLITTPRAIEGLTGDKQGNLYTGGSVTVATTPITPCPIWKININNPALVEVGKITPNTLPSTCGFAGIALNDIGDVFVAD